MAYLNKHQYDYRRESAAKRNISNEEIAVENGMTDEQAELITELCSARHEMHCNISHLVEDGSYDKIGDYLIDINMRLKSTNIPIVPNIPCDNSDYIDIDDMYTLFETVQLPDDDDERENFLAGERERIYDCWENLNKVIEHYLADIDKKYGTSWCPSGALRIF